MSTTQRNTLTIVGATVAVLIALLGVLTGASLAESSQNAGVTAHTAPTVARIPTSDVASDGGAAVAATAPAGSSSPVSTPQSAPQPASGPATDPAPEAGPKPGPEEPTMADCAAPHEQGTWTVDGPGDAVAVADMAPFGGECAGVFLTLDGPAGDMDVERNTTTDTTVVRFLGTGPGPEGITNDAIDFAVTDSRISWAVAFSDMKGFGVVLYHPNAVGPDLGAHVDVDGSAVTISVREQTADDPQTADAIGGDHRLPRGPVFEGLLVDRISETSHYGFPMPPDNPPYLPGDEEWSGQITVSGYAKAPGSLLQFQVHDAGNALVCESTLMAEGAPHHFSAFAATCEFEMNGPGETYEVSIGWPGTSEDPDETWHTEEVTIGA